MDNSFLLILVSLNSVKVHFAFDIVVILIYFYNTNKVTYVLGFIFLVPCPDMTGFRCTQSHHFVWTDVELERNGPTEMLLQG